MKSEMAEVKLAKLCIELMQERFIDEGSHTEDIIVGVKLVGNGVQPVYKTGPKKKLPIATESNLPPKRTYAGELKRLHMRESDWVLWALGTQDTAQLPHVTPGSGEPEAYVIRMLGVTLTYSDTYSVWLAGEEDWLRTSRGDRRAFTYVESAEEAMWKWECEQAQEGK